MEISASAKINRYTLDLAKMAITTGLKVRFKTSGSIILPSAMRKLLAYIPQRMQNLGRL